MSGLVTISSSREGVEALDAVLNPDQIVMAVPHPNGGIRVVLVEGHEVNVSKVELAAFAETWAQARAGR